jgi:archaellin
VKNRRELGSVVAALVASMLWCASARAAWYDTNWQHRKKFTVNATLVAAPQTNFPVLVSLVDPELAAYAQNDGDDILFTAADGVTKLDHEIELFDGGTGRLVAWVRVPSLSASSVTPTEIFLYYGNAAAANQQNPTGVWDPNFRIVYHLGDAAAVNDSTSFANNATNFGTTDETSGSPGTSQYFNEAENDRIDAGNVAAINSATALTGCAWMYHDTLSNDDYIIGKSGDIGGGAYRGFLFLRDDVGGVSARTDIYKIFVQDEGFQVSLEGATDASPQQDWTHVCFTYRANTAAGLRLYVNGVEDPNSPLDTTNIIDLSSPAAITLGMNSPVDYLNGRMDELRLSTSVRSPSWIQTEYNSVRYQGAGPGRFLLTEFPPEVPSDIEMHTHIAGQEQNAFSTSTAVTGAELAAFRLENTTAGALQVDELAFTVSSVSGLSQADFSNLEITIDDDNDGIIETGETTSVGGAGIVDSTVSSMTFSSSFTVGAGATINYVLSGDVSNLAPGDRMTISLGSAGVTLSSGTIGGPGMTPVTHSTYRGQKTITVAAGEVGSSCTGSLTDFPILVNVAGDNDLRTTGNGGHVEITDGWDIVFTDTSGNRLDHEIERYTPATGELVAWVRIPTLSNVTDTVLYLSFGNDTVSAPTENPAGVWDANHTGVWHLEESPPDGVAGHNDSTSPAQDGTPLGFEDGGGGSTNVTGLASGADYFADEVIGSTNRIEVINDPSLYPDDDMTVEAWIYVDDPTTANHVLYMWDGASFSYQMWIGANASLDHVARFQWRNSTGTTATAIGVTPLVANTWHHVVGIRRGSNVEVHLDGDLDNTAGGATGIVNPPSDNFVIGACWSGGGGLNGQVDEVRISNIARSQCWLETEYNNLRPGSPMLEVTGGDVSLDPHPAGQVTNAFTSTGNVTDAQLFAFQLTNNTAGDRQVDRIDLPLSAIGLTSGELANLQISVDADNDGTISGGETTTVGGTGSVDTGVTTLSFTTPFSLGAGTTESYILKGDASNIAPGDRLVVSLGPAGLTLVSGTTGGTAPTPAIHTLSSTPCCSLTTSADASTLTVTAPDAFELRFNEATGGGIDRFYDLEEDPTRAVDLVGSATPNGASLHGAGFEVGGTWYNASAHSSAEIELLESTRTRVRVRRLVRYEDSGGNLLPGARAAADYTITPTGRAALRWHDEMSTDFTYSYHDLDMNLRYAGILTAWSNFSDAGLLPGGGLSDFLLAQIEVEDARTDFLKIALEDWTTANGYLGEANDSDNSSISLDERNLLTWRDLDNILVPAGHRSTRDFLTYYKPTNFIDHADPAVTERRDDYRNQISLSTTYGGPWTDSSENTDSDSFNEAEGAYALTFDPTQPTIGLRFTIDGSTHNRFQPVFKIRKWRSFSDPRTILFDADSGGPTPEVTLANDVNYGADVKPVARAHFAQDLVWYSTLESGTVVSPNVGPGGESSPGLSASAGRISGNGVRFDADGEYFRIPAAGQFDPLEGTIEFWYQPMYDYTAWSGTGLDAAFFGYWNDSNNFFYAFHEQGATQGLKFLIEAGGVRSEVVVGSSAGILWNANEWVHLRFTWDRPGSRMEVWVDGRLVGSSSYDAAPAMPSDGWFYVGDRNRSGTVDDNARGVIDEIHFYSSAATPAPLARGGYSGASEEYLAVGGRNATLSFAPVTGDLQGEYFYIGSDSELTGLNVVLDTPGAGDADLLWEYWNGTDWATLSSGAFSFNDTTNDLKQDGVLYWNDPGDWTLYSFNGGPDLYYIRAHLASGSYNGGANFPIEAGIKTDILLVQYSGTITANAQFTFGPLSPTEVELLSFEAQPRDGAVALTWETGSEIDNLGFHLYRSQNEDGPYERITSRPIPGLGSSPAGAEYEYVDSGLTNGVMYFYQLEDIETTGRTERHGPVSATPTAEAPSADEDPTRATLTYGDPSASSFRVLSENVDELVLELETGGFYAAPLEDGTVLIEIPNFVSTEGAPIPVRRSWVDVLAGRKVTLVSVETFDKEMIDGWAPALVGAPKIEATRRTVRATRARRPRPTRQRFGWIPEEPARLLEVGYQGEVKKALVEMAPLRWDGRRLVLAKRMVVRLSLRGRDPDDRLPSRMRARRSRRDLGDTVVRLVTQDKGLYAVPLSRVFGRTRTRVRADRIRLSRQGEDVSFHVEAGRLYFLSEGADANPYGNEAVYELEVGVAGTPMLTRDATPSGDVLEHYRYSLEQEKNLLYYSTLLAAPDRWLWKMLFAPVRESFSFTVDAPAPSTESSRLEVWLQGASDFPADPDHHVRVYVNGTFVAETSWDGEQPQKLDLELFPGVLADGDNTLELENVGDTEADYSMVLLDRFRVNYPRRSQAMAGYLEGQWTESGTAEVRGVSSGEVVVDTTAEPVWLTGATPVGSSLRFRTEAGSRFVAASAEAVLLPEIRRPLASRWKRTDNEVDWLAIGPREFLSTAKPLLELRRNGGLRAKAVAIEEVYSEFGFGESTPESIRDFLVYSAHHWNVPPRYVVLLGDATYDFKDNLGTGVVNRVPPLLVETTYLETVSDPALAAVNGDDSLPDLAIGRLPAADVGELQNMIDKIVAFETSDRLLDGRVVLVTDNPDKAGNFQTNAEELSATVLSARELRKIYLGRMGFSATRDAIQAAFDEGASLMSYIGHGGIHLWADENILNIYDVPNLASQSEQPLLLTMNCLNGYFHFPYFDALSEALVKAEGKGAIAAFSPSGLSLNDAAHCYHRILLEEIIGGYHGRLGDAVLAAQIRYAETGIFTEALTIYHLLGDPALSLR